MMKDDKLVIGGHTFDSRFILGSGKYSMKLIEAAVQDAGAQIITLAVRRANTKAVSYTHLDVYKRQEQELGLYMLGIKQQEGAEA